MKNKRKRPAALMTAILFGMSFLSGCGDKTDSSSSVQTSHGTLENTSSENKEASDGTSSAMGRYLENEIPLPEGADCIFDITKLQTGQLRSAGTLETGGAAVWDISDGGDWTKAYDVPETVTESGDIINYVISPTGTAFASVLDPAGDDYIYWTIDDKGNTSQLTLEVPSGAAASNLSNNFFNMDFSQDGRLVGSTYDGCVYEINTSDGTLGKNLNEQETLLRSFGCVGSDLFMMDTSSTRFLNLESGETTVLPEVLKNQFHSYINDDVGFSYKKLVSLDKGADGNLFYACEDGIYSYISGGSITEQVVNGSLTSLKDPSFGILTFEAMPDNSFYVLGSIDNQSLLLHYVYSKDTPTVPSTELHLYSLNDDTELRQAVVQFQKEHPDIYVDLEIGRTDSDGVTASDALRTLNTEIMAGKGPDILKLDELPIQSYMEKGLLLDVSDVVSAVREEEGLVGTITDTFFKDGSVYAVPCKFSIPLIYGPEKKLKQITDLASLASVLTQIKEERTDLESVLGFISPVMFAEQLYDVCSAAWRKEDGTLDQAAVTEYYTRLFEMYELDEAFHKENAEDFQSTKEFSAVRDPRELKQLSDGAGIIVKQQDVIMGVSGGMQALAFSLSADEKLDGYNLALLNGQASNVFIPNSVLGISSKSPNQEAAKKFLSFMLSSKMQTGSASQGFPVNRKAFETEMTTEKEYGGSLTVADSDGNIISLEAKYPSKEIREALTKWVESLSTPSLTDFVVHEAIMDQVDDCLTGVITPEQASSNAIQKVNLYLSE